MLADTSSSISAQDLQTESAFAGQARARPRTPLDAHHSVRSRAPASPSPDERLKSNWQLHHTAGAAGHGTNLESAIRDGAAALPAGMVPRLLLISDGNENLGSVSRAIWQAQQLGVPIDTVPLAGRPKPGLVLESVAFPGQVFSGERFPIEVTPGSLRAPPRQPSISRPKARRSAATTSTSPPATNHLRLQASVNSVGAIALAGKVVADGLGEARFEDAVTLRSPRVLLLSRDPCSQRTAPDPRAPGEPVRSGARHRRHPRQARQLSARRDQQLGHGERSRCRARPPSRIS